MIRWLRRHASAKVVMRDGSLLSWPVEIAERFQSRPYDEEDPYAREIGGES